jgi:hypothetical protein
MSSDAGWNDMHRRVTGARFSGPEAEPWKLDMGIQTLGNLLGGETSPVVGGPQLDRRLPHLRGLVQVSAPDPDSFQVIVSNFHVTSPSVLGVLGDRKEDIVRPEASMYAYMESGGFVNHFHPSVGLPERVTSFGARVNFATHTAHVLARETDGVERQIGPLDVGGRQEGCHVDAGEMAYELLHYVGLAASIKRRLQWQDAARQQPSVNRHPGRV